MNSGLSAAIILTSQTSALNGFDPAVSLGVTATRPAPPPGRAPAPDPHPIPPPRMIVIFGDALSGPTPGTTIQPGRGPNRASNPIVLPPQPALGSGCAESSGTRSPECSVSCTEPPGAVTDVPPARTRCQSTRTTASSSVRRS